MISPLVKTMQKLLIIITMLFQSVENSIMSSPLSYIFIIFSYCHHWYLGIGKLFFFSFFYGHLKYCLLVWS